MDIFPIELDTQVTVSTRYPSEILEALWELTKVAVNQLRSFDSDETSQSGLNKVIESRNGEELELGAGLVAIVSAKQERIYLTSNLLYHSLAKKKVSIPQELISAIEEKIKIPESIYEELLEKEGLDLSSCYGSEYRKSLRDRTDYFMLKRKAKLAKRLQKED